jgi:hypothetical protein
MKVEKNAGARQLLGMKGASDTDNKWAIRLQLTKPVTWVPLIWGVLCGAAASGEFSWTAENVEKSLLCMTMSGPLLTGYTQVRRGCHKSARTTTQPRAKPPQTRCSQRHAVTAALRRAPARPIRARRRTSCRAPSILRVRSLLPAPSLTRCAPAWRR